MLKNDFRYTLGRFWVIFFVALSLLTTALPSSPLAQQSKEPLKLTLKSDKSVYRAGELITIKAVLQNTSKETITVCDYGIGVLRFKVTRDGQSVETSTAEAYGVEASAAQIFHNMKDLAPKKINFDAGNRTTIPKRAVPKRTTYPRRQ